MGICSSMLVINTCARGVGNQKRPVRMHHSRRPSSQPAGGNAVSATRLKLIPWPAIAVQLVRY